VEPGAFAVACRPHGGGQQQQLLFDCVFMFIGDEIEYSTCRHALLDRSRCRLHVGTRSVTLNPRRSSTSLHSVALPSQP
jgi:hypothetical protein